MSSIFISLRSISSIRLPYISGRNLDEFHTLRVSTNYFDVKISRKSLDDTHSPERRIVLRADQKFVKETANFIHQTGKLRFDETELPSLESAISLLIGRNVPSKKRRN